MENSDKIKAVFELARDGSLEKHGMKQLPVRNSWNFTDKFPEEAFVVRGPICEEIFSWKPDLVQQWNTQGIKDAAGFVDRQPGVFGRVTTCGDKVGLPNSETLTFELPNNDNDPTVMYKRYPNVTVRSLGCLAARGFWFTPTHIEWGGGESIGLVISGTKLWIMAYEKEASKSLHSGELDSLAKLYMLLASPPGYNNGRWESMFKNCFYHIAQVGDIIVQPAFAAHCVFTEEIVQNGKQLWSLVTGYEGVDLRVEDRGRRVFNYYECGVARPAIAPIVLKYGAKYLLRLLWIKDYRYAVKIAKKEGRSNCFSCLEPSNVTIHCQELVRVGYDLANSFQSAKNYSPSAKQVRRANLNQNNEPSSPLTDLTKEEEEAWPLCVIEHLEKIWKKT